VTARSQIEADQTLAAREGNAPLQLVFDDRLGKIRKAV
jgi:hypothetical protein